MGIAKYLGKTTKPYKCLKLKLIIVTGLVSAVVIFFMITDIQAFHKNWVVDGFFLSVTVANRVPPLHMSYIFLQYHAILSVITQNFKLLNNRLKQIAASCIKLKRQLTLSS